MLSLLKKELNSFFGSITGYLVVILFLLSTSLFLWVIPGGFNIIDGQRSTLKDFFELAPWLYLFLIPAITMRMFAEEKRMGTLEMLITRPITLAGITFSKFMAAVLLVFITLLPTLLFFYSVYQLGTPIGNIDTGATWGSYIGLLLLAIVYVSIGLFASALTPNQVIAFLLAAFLSYFFYVGFEFLSVLPLGDTFQNVASKLSIDSHYQSISRGVVDSRDIGYFIFTSALLLLSTSFILKKKNKKAKPSTKNSLVIALILIGWGLSVNINIFRIDLTYEKRYSITSTTKEILKKQKEPIIVELYLAGDLPAGMKEFQEAIIEKISDLNAHSLHGITCKVIDIYKIKTENERNKYIEGLEKSGIYPVSLEHNTNEGLSTKRIYPGVLVLTKDNGIAMNLLKNNPLLTADDNLKNSIELLEYAFVSAFKTLQQSHKPIVAFLQGHGEANNYETGDIRYQLSQNYHVINTHCDELTMENSVDVLVIADPTERIEERDKLIIDQYVMKGGKVLWCIDPIFASIDSLSRGTTTIAFDRDLNLRDLLFNYGIRLNADLLQDANCVIYPINTQPIGQPSKMVSAPFYYSPLALPNPNHPLSRNLNNVWVEFVSSVDLVGEHEGTKKSIVLGTSPYGRSIQTPVEISLMSATNPPDKRLFNTPNIPIAALIEGEIKSAFANRITDNYGIPSQNIIAKSKHSKMIVIADGGIIKNKVRNRNGQVQILSLGYDQHSGQTFGNADFIKNCIDYLADDIGIMEIRSKVVKLRPLDKVRLRNEKLKWQLINCLAPIILFVFAGLAYNFYRKRKFTSVLK